MHVYSWLLPRLGLAVLCLSVPHVAQAQSVIPAEAGTTTIVTPAGDRIDITGGTLSGDGANLFHTFQEFGLSTEQIANFLVNPDIQNILSSVSGGNPSVINGVLQVSGGSANLFLINPSGILLGPDSALNLSGSFTATTADGIGFGERQFTVVGRNDHAALVGQPDTFVFTLQQPGAIVNAGDLTVQPGEQLTLLGGTVVNTGTLSAPGGTVTIAAVTGEQVVRISQDNAVLSLDLPVPEAPAAASPPVGEALTPLDLPGLLTGGEVGIAAGVEVGADGTVTLTGSAVALPPEAGTAIAAGEINTDCVTADCNTAPQVGGTVRVLGDTVGVLDGTLTATGVAGGGEILVGGDYKGEGMVPNATVTVVDGDSTLAADAIEHERQPLAPGVGEDQQVTQGRSVAPRRIFVEAVLDLAQELLGLGTTTRRCEENGEPQKGRVQDVARAGTGPCGEGRAGNPERATQGRFGVGSLAAALGQRSLHAKDGREDDEGLGMDGGPGHAEALEDPAGLGERLGAPRDPSHVARHDPEVRECRAESELGGRAIRQEAGAPEAEVDGVACVGQGRVRAATQAQPLARVHEGRDGGPDLGVDESAGEVLHVETELVGVAGTSGFEQQVRQQGDAVGTRLVDHALGPPEVARGHSSSKPSPKPGPTTSSSQSAARHDRLRSGVLPSKRRTLTC